MALSLNASKTSRWRNATSANDARCAIGIASSIRLGWVVPRSSTFLGHVSKVRISAAARTSRDRTQSSPFRTTRIIWVKYPFRDFECTHTLHAEIGLILLTHVHVSLSSLEWWLLIHLTMDLSKIETIKHYQIIVLLYISALQIYNYLNTPVNWTFEYIFSWNDNFASFLLSQMKEAYIASGIRTMLLFITDVFIKTFSLLTLFVLNNIDCMNNQLFII